MTVVVAHQRLVSADIAGSAGQWLYAGEDPAWAIEHGRTLLEGLERVTAGPMLAAAADALRRPYLDWIGELGVVNDSFAWWSSQLAAKNVYTHLFQRLCALRVAEERLEDGMLVVCSTPVLVTEVADAARRRGLAVAEHPGDRSVVPRARTAAYGPFLVSRARLRARESPRPEAATGQTLLATWIDDRSFPPAGGFRDPHFGPLAALLREQGQRVELLARVMPDAPFRANARRLLDCGEPAFLPDAFVTPRDRWECWKVALAFRPRIADDAAVAGVPAARLARELIEEQRETHADALTYGPLVKRMAAAGVRPARVVLPWEGHGWETALTRAVHEHLPETRVVAYDNLNFSRLALSLYPGAAEIGVRPLPDRVVTNGPTFARVLREEGFPAERIRVGCALRHAELLEREPPEAPAGERERYVLAAGSIDASQTIELIVTAAAAFGPDLVVKLHPLVDAARVRRAVGDGVRFVDRTLSDLLPQARALLYTYSVVPYEALLAGVPPIFVQSETLLDLDQLEPTPDVRWEGRTPQELRDALAAAEAAAATSVWRERAAAVVRDALAPRGPGCVQAFLADAAGRPG